MKSSTPVSDLLSQVQDSLNSYCNASIVRSFLNSDQNRKMRELWDGFASKHRQIDGGRPSVGGSRTSNGCSINFRDDAIYNGPFSADGESYQGRIHETLKCELMEKKSWGGRSISPICYWSAELCYAENEVSDNEWSKGSMCVVEKTIKFNLDGSNTEGIPKETPDEMAKRIIEHNNRILGTSGNSANNIPPSPSPNVTGPGKAFAIAAGVASTAYFAYKACYETRRIYEGNEQQKDTPNKAKEKASGWRALGYATAAIGSGALTVYALKI